MEEILSKKCLVHSSLWCCIIELWALTFEVAMKLKTLSAYRLKSKAIATNKKFTTPSGVSFSVLVSKDSNSVAQYYVVESHWDNNKSKVVPLAHLQVNRASGKIKYETFQPENWNLSIATSDLKQLIITTI